jgi:hypothetical protein
VREDWRAGEAGGEHTIRPVKPSRQRSSVHNTSFNTYCLSSPQPAGDHQPDVELCLGNLEEISDSGTV